MLHNLLKTGTPAHRIVSHFSVRLVAWLVCNEFLPEQTHGRDEKNRNGRITVIAGEMFSGKSEELLRWIERNTYAKIPFAVFKPRRDTRTPREVRCRSGRAVEAIEVDSSQEILEYIIAYPEIKVVGIDEAQFFVSDDNVVEIVRTLADKFHIVIFVAGLDMDFAGRPFGHMPALMAIATEVRKVHAVCVDCGRTASYSRLKVPIEGQILVGSDMYEAVCRGHRPF